MEAASGNYTEVSSVLQAPFSMSTSEATFEPHPSRPKRADALRNHERLIAAAREAFAEGGAATSLEEIARRAEVGIGTLYRNFPTRQLVKKAASRAMYEKSSSARARLGRLGRGSKVVSAVDMWNVLDKTEDTSV